MPSADQSWFWTARWQEGEREATAQIAAGEATFYGSDAEFLAALDAIGSTASAPPAVSTEDNTQL